MPATVASVHFDWTRGDWFEERDSVDGRCCLDCWYACGGVLGPRPATLVKMDAAKRPVPVRAGSTKSSPCFSRSDTSTCGYVVLLRRRLICAICKSPKLTRIVTGNSMRRGSRASTGPRPANQKS